MLVNKKTIRYILYTFPIFLLLIFPLVMGCVVYAINLNSQLLDPSNTLIDFINNYLPFNASYSVSGDSFDIILNNTPDGSILSDLYLNLFNGLVLPTSSNLGLPYYLFNYMFYSLGIFVLYIIFIVFIYVPKLCITLLDKHLDKISGVLK